VKIKTHIKAGPSEISG